MNKHTPGPWTFYDDSNDGKTNRIEIVAIGKTVAHIYHSVPTEDLPNARLIAAAPDLLEALRKCDEAMTWELGGEPLDTLMTDARNSARAALAKVEASK